MTNYHFNYEGEVVITAETQEEAEEQLKHMLRGVFSYKRIHHSVGMLAEQLLTTQRAQKLIDDSIEFSMRPKKDDRKKLIAFILRELNKQFDDWGGDEPSCCVFREIVDFINEVEAL